MIIVPAPQSPVDVRFVPETLDEANAYYQRIIRRMARDLLEAKNIPYNEDEISTQVRISYEHMDNGIVRYMKMNNDVPPDAFKNMRHATKEEIKTIGEQQCK